MVILYFASCPQNCVLGHVGARFDSVIAGVQDTRTGKVGGCSDAGMFGQVKPWLAASRLVFWILMDARPMASN